MDEDEDMKLFGGHALLTDFDCCDLFCREAVKSMEEMQHD
jgi:hypothetical protein